MSIGRERGARASSQERREKEKNGGKMRDKRRREENGKTEREIATRDCIERGFAPLGGLQELDFNPLESISTLERREIPGERKREYSMSGWKGGGEGKGSMRERNPLLPATAAPAVLSRGLK